MVLKGDPVSSGKSIGIILLKKELRKIEKELNINSEDELKKYNVAKEKSIAQIQELYQKASESSDDGTADIFQGHEMLIDDLDFVDMIENNIKDKHYTAKYSIYVASHEMRDIFLQMDSDYMKERAADITDISNRLIMNLLEDSVDVTIEEDKKYIFVGEELFASDTLKIDKKNLAGFATRKGSYSAHSGILARTLNIPSLINVEIEKLENGMICLIDADNGELYIDPTEEQIKQYEQYVSEKQKENEVYTQYKNKTIIINGKHVELCGNIGNDDEAIEAIENGGDGIGLFRSEFLFIQSNKAPTEEEQFEAYKNALETAKGKRVVVRTIDIGADKKVDYINIAEEDNPALGVRGVRISFKEERIFDTQLRALLRASNYGKLAVMFPMIINLEEIAKIKNLINNIKAEYDRDGVPYKDMEIGIMIETPASVIIADLLAEEVDFFSVGTNDLTQYTLAVDRMNPEVVELYDYNHEAINRMIKHVIDVAHEKGIWVGVCGESASNIELALKYIEMGIDELSITPVNIPKIKYEICKKYNID